MACMALHMCEMPDELYLDGYAKNDHNSLKFLKVHRHSDHVEPTLHFMSDDTDLLSLRLRLLHWDAFPLTDFPRRFRPLGLIEVSLRYSNLTSLLEGTKVKRSSAMCYILKLAICLFLVVFLYLIPSGYYT